MSVNMFGVIASMLSMIFFPIFGSNLEVFKSRDNLLHERSDLLSAMVVDQVLELLANISSDIININNVDVVFLAFPAGHTSGPLCSSVHTRFSYFISETPDNMNELFKLET